MANKPKLSEEQRITLGQLQAFEITYVGLRSVFDTAKADSRASKAEYDRLSGEVEELITLLEEEEDDARRQALRTDLAKKKKDLEELGIRTSVKKATKDQLKNNIDQSVEQMKELPGVREAIQELVEKRYDKEIKRLEKEEKTQSEDKETMEKIQELTDEDKTDNAQEISDNFKDMLDARNEIKKIKAQIKDLDERIASATDGATRDSLNQQRADVVVTLGEAQGRYQTAKTRFIALSKDADVEFEEKDVDHIVAVVNDGMKRRPNRENDYSLEKVLKKQIAKTDKGIQSLQAQKEEYVKGKTAIQEERGQAGQAQTPQERVEQAVQERQQALQEQEKLHWWNFIKKHKRKKELKQYKEDLERLQPTEEERAQQQAENDKAHKAFVRELQRNATIESIVNREMRETRDRAADVKRSFEENDR